MLTRPEPPPEAERAKAICAAHGDKPDALIEILHELQHDLGYVPEVALPAIANALNISRAEVHGVVTFYHDFRRSPPGRHIVQICRAAACPAMQGEDLRNPATASVKTCFGETTADGEVTLQAVYCLGNCALSPAMMVDGNLYGRVDPKRFDAIMAKTRKGAQA